MAKERKAFRLIFAGLALPALLFFLHLSHSNPYSGKKIPTTTPSITGPATQYYQSGDSFIENSEKAELSFDGFDSQKIHNPGLLDSKTSRQDRFPFRFCKLLAQYLLNIPPPISA